MGEMVTIRIEEYQRLCAAAEDLADIAAYDSAMQAIARGDDELVPAEFANRLIAGENKLRVWREYRGLTQTALANLSAVNRVQIADIEAGRGRGSVETLRKLAAALRVTIEDLV
jgi:DNA-binding XRE family transcriptional regulator